MTSAPWRKSVTELTRRRARAALVVATLALAVASIGLFAVPPLMDRAMRDEVAAARLADLTVQTRPLAPGRARLAALRRLPNVAALQPTASFATRVYVGARRQRAVIVAIPRFARQPVDVVHVAAGAAPRRGEVLTELRNARQGRLDVAAGGSVRVVAADGSARTLRVSGEGRSLGGGQEATGERVAILYATSRTITDLGGPPGFTSFAFRLRDTRAAEIDATLQAVRRTLRATPGFAGFSDLPDVRAAGEWPGREEFHRFSQLFTVVTVLALISSLVLVSNTMTTLVAEQTSEIGTMKAVGGRRRQIAAIYLRTATMLGALGALAGVALGVALANALVRLFGSTFFAIDAGLGVDVPVAVAGLVVGVLGPVLAALPAVRRGVRLPVRDALEATGSAVGGAGRLDRALRRVGFLPQSARIGLRGAARRKRRSLATVLQVGLAVGLLLAFLGLGTSVGRFTHASWSERPWATTVWSTSQRPLDARAVALIRATPGVTGAQPLLLNEAELRGTAGFVYGLPARTLLRVHVVDGRWYSPREDRARARVAVVESGIAGTSGARVGDVVSVGTASGPLRLRVIGIADNAQEGGTVLFVPLRTLASALGARPAANQYWVTMAAPSHAAIDATTTAIEDALGARGYQPGTEINYVGERDNAALNRSITMTITILGLIIVAISMVGLVNAITMSVIERTREIGILRCVGARGRDIRRIFTAEAIALALAGWALGIPLGYLLDRLVTWLLSEIVHLDLPVVFPAGNLVLALLGTAVLAVLITLLPLRRAVRLRPGDALRTA